MYLGTRGIRNVLKYKHSPVFIVSYLGYMVVGLGSMAFHTTLYCLSSHPRSRRRRVVCKCVSDRMLDSMQLADELPMIYTVCIMGYATFSYRKSGPVQVLVALIMVAIAGGITVRNPAPPPPLSSPKTTKVSSPQAAYADQ